MLPCKFIYEYIKSFSFIIFIITIFLVLTKSSINLLPLNILVFIGSIFLYHIYPNYYKIIREKYPKYKKLLLISDILIHYIPLLVGFNMIKTTTISYYISFIIMMMYFIIFNSQLYNIYLNFEKYLVK